jgi:hypothetical protein
MSMDNAINHLAEEIEQIEHINPWGRAIRWIGGGLLIAAFIAWIAWILTSPPSATTAAKFSYVPLNVASIDMSEPVGGTLDQAPVRFAWESVTGRFQYIVRAYEKGVTVPFFERASTASSFELTPEERAKFTRGKTFVWTVVAQGKNGTTIGAGQSGFKVR